MHRICNFHQFLSDCWLEFWFRILKSESYKFSISRNQISYKNRSYIFATNFQMEISEIDNRVRRRQKQGEKEHQKFLTEVSCWGRVKPHLNRVATNVRASEQQWATFRENKFLLQNSSFWRDHELGEVVLSWHAIYCGAVGIY